MTKIDLMALAKKADEMFVDVECSFGTMRVYHVPDALLLSMNIGLAEPEQPTVSMRTATGIQERPSKKGDPVYDEWQTELGEYREQMFRMRQAKGFVAALQDVPWEDIDLSNPPPVKIAQEIYNGNWPEDDTLRKMAWIDYVILTVREDKDKVLAAMTTMNEATEPSENMVSEVKKNSV